MYRTNFGIGHSIKEILEARELRENDPKVLALVEYFRENKSEFLFSLELTEMELLYMDLDLESPMGIVLLALEGFGLKSIPLRRENEVYVYSAPKDDFEMNNGKPVLDKNGDPIPVSDLREEIFEAWFLRDKQGDN